MLLETDQEANYAKSDVQIRRKVLYLSIMVPVAGIFIGIVEAMLAF